MTIYDPQKVVMTFGPLPIIGFADGSMIAVNYLGEGDQAQVGTQGEAVIIRSHDQRAEVTVRLMRTGAGRDVLAALLGQFNAGNPPLPLIIASIDTGDGHAAGTAVMKKPPNADYGKEAPIAEVVFVCAKFASQTAPDPAPLAG